MIKIKGDRAQRVKERMEEIDVELEVEKIQLREVDELVMVSLNHLYETDMSFREDLNSFFMLYVEVYGGGKGDRNGR